jgi:hypothetical protein
MPKHPHWLPQLIVQADKYNNAAANFLQGHILDHVVNGRVHAEIHPHRSDEGGTRSLRFSYSDPPLQLMPSRDEELTPLIRGVFLPEEGEVWAKPDISQQEFRFIVQYAVKHGLARAGQATDRYRGDPDTDFHDLVAEMTGLARKDAKAVNFAKAFGAGVRKFAAMIDKPEGEARAIYDGYDRDLPFVSQLAKLCQRTAMQRGYLKLYDGARRHWEGWEVPGVAWVKGAGPCSREEALRRINDPDHPWHGCYAVRRAETHKAMNALIQGSAARHTKLWMRARTAPCPAAHSRQHNGAKIHLAAAQADPIQLPQTSVAEANMPPLADVIGMPLRDGKICCPFHADSTPSLHLYDDHFHCFGCGAHGDHIDWLMMVEGMDRDEAVRVLKSWDHPIVRPRPAPEGEEEKRRLALQLWHDARPIAGTLAARYLSERRRIDVAALPDGDAALRFHPSCLFGSGVRKPCLIALLRDVVTDEAIGIHRIALTPDADRIERRMLGGAGAVKLWPAASQLIVGEGIETVLAAATRILYHGAPLRPAWSALSSGFLGKLPVVPGVERLLILVDHDVNGEGQRAAARCTERWSRAGRGVIQLKPKRLGDDFNDVIMRGRLP